MSYDESKAAAYEDDPEHVLPPEERDIWLTRMRQAAGDAGLRGRLLDVGAGTGLLMAVMKQAGLSVIGLEPSQAMIAEALRRHPVLQRGDFTLGHAAEAGLFGRSSFDWLVSRQVLCHLSNPMQTFGIWRGWLRPGGFAILVDGFWPRSAWNERDLVHQPFAALENTQPVADALAGAGFDVVEARPFIELNDARAARWAGARSRYLVVARRG